MDDRHKLIFKGNNPTQQYQDPKPSFTNNQQTKNSTLQNDNRINNKDKDHLNHSQSQNCSSDEDEQEGLPLSGLSKKQALLAFKINELQKICVTLTQANKKLLDRVDELENLRGNSESSSECSLRESELNCIEQETQLHNGFVQIQNLVKDYRISLENCRIKIQGRIFEKQRVNDILKEQIQRLATKNVVLEKKNAEIQKTNSIILLRNEQLQVQLSNCKNNKNMSYQKTPFMLKTSEKSYQTFHDQLQTEEEAFQEAVHSQLQLLIQKLVNELEHERKLKQKMKAQIKRLGKQLIESEKQLMAKNSKIYLLQLNVLERDRVSLTKTNKENVREVDDSLLSYKKNEHESPSMSKKSFTIIDLLNNAVCLCFRQKLYIAWKILQFYDKKLMEEDFSTLMVEDIEIHNFTDKNYNLITIKCGSRQMIDSSEQESRERVIFNMAFILDTLMNQVVDEEDMECNNIKNEEQKQQLTKILQYILASQSDSFTQSVEQLKNYIRQTIISIEQL